MQILLFVCYNFVTYIDAVNFSCQLSYIIGQNGLKVYFHRNRVWESLFQFSFEQHYFINVVYAYVVRKYHFLLSGKRWEVTNLYS